MTDNDSNGITIELGAVREILEVALAEAEKLDGTASSVDDDSTNSNRSHVAALGRDLLYLADALQAASVLVKSEYWALKGKSLVP